MILFQKTTLSKNGIFKNLYIHYSTINGYVSYCDANNGSIFTQALYNVFKDYEMDLNQLSIKIKHEMKKNIINQKGYSVTQVSHVKSRLSYKIKFIKKELTKYDVNHVDHHTENSNHNHESVTRSEKKK